LGLYLTKRWEKGSPLSSFRSGYYTKGYKEDLNEKPGDWHFNMQ
jgi:hypothetical protein